MPPKEMNNMNDLEIGSRVNTKRGIGYIVKVDNITYIVPMYHVLLISNEYSGDVIYISDPRITPELTPSAPKLSTAELDVICAELEFNIKRNFITGAVTCPQCGIRYYEIDNTNITNIETDTPNFYCVNCGGKL